MSKSIGKISGDCECGNKEKFSITRKIMDNGKVDLNGGINDITVDESHSDRRFFHHVLSCGECGKFVKYIQTRKLKSYMKKYKIPFVTAEKVEK